MNAWDQINKFVSAIAHFFGDKELPGIVLHDALQFVAIGLILRLARLLLSSQAFAGNEIAEFINHTSENLVWVAYVIKLFIVLFEYIVTRLVRMFKTIAAEADR